MHTRKSRFGRQKDQNQNSNLNHRNRKKGRGPKRMSRCSHFRMTYCLVPGSTNAGTNAGKGTSKSSAPSIIEELEALCSSIGCNQFRDIMTSFGREVFGLENLQQEQQERRGQQRL